MNEKRCLKCGHVCPYREAAPQACPGCGAIYAKVEEALRDGRPVRPPASPVAAGLADFQDSGVVPALSGRRTAPGRNLRNEVHGFALRMREQSLYPVWRRLVGLFAWVGYALAALMLLGAAVGLWKGGVMAVPVFFAGALGAVVVLIFTKVGKELSLMVADLSDAAVHLAARSEDA